MPVQPVHFSEAALKFLRGLKRNNDRIWFDERKPIYEAELKAPLLALIDEVNAGLARFSPEHVRPAPKVMMRIYRDIRFSKNKAPYKTHVSAWWARQGLEKTSGGGFYFHLDANEIHIAAGVYMPEREQLLAIRSHLAEHHAEYRKIMASKKLKASMQVFDGNPMARGPKGYPADHPAMDLLVQRQWGVIAVLPAARALEPTLARDIVEHFRLAAPMVSFLNRPLASRPKAPLF
ncbi:DUF2461 domain-containing protein [Granulicella sp. WH15]|uniref:DUF2461 domain-containing protein n=1 Tax=Granulicella sp. WH15 TaxID=2602070 RepID=UPI0013677439|nr:DUF2461 domain-containing protein [Granulicella sp. WH15]QHN05232.1 DUF2461 domain-containing protein [Granulicella sp. WH15]